LPFPSPNTWQKRLTSLPEGAFSFVACRADEVLGQIGIEMRKNPRRRHAATLGMAVKTSARRQGVGSALLTAGINLAERWLAVRRIELEVYTDNEAAVALYKKFGFVVEGTLRQYAFRDGQFADVYLMAKLAA
jgi:L-phenylalanine/L-methionine N-acetyltransferase